MKVQREITANGRSLFERPPICPPEYLPGLALLVDTGALLLGSALGLAMAGTGLSAIPEAALFTMTFVVLVQISLFRHGGFYRTEALLWPGCWIDIVLASNAASVLFVLAMLHALNAQGLFPIEWIVLWSAGSVGMLLLFRTAVSLILLRLQKGGRIGQRTAVVIAGDTGRRFLNHLSGRSETIGSRYGLFYPDPPLIGAEIAGGMIMGNLEDLMRLARVGQVDEIVLALSSDEFIANAGTIHRLRELPVDVLFAPDISETGLPMRPSAARRTGIPLLEVWRKPITGWHRFAKLAVDCVLALLATILFAPVFAIAAIAIRLDSPGPILFRQKRVGFNNEVFEILKFRTMYHRKNREDRVVQAQRFDPRVTRVGRILRRTSLDELPQLLNVLNGTMSLVGPRPHALSHNEDFSRAVRGYFSRHKVRPGITGWAQVNGLRGEIDTSEKLKARVAHDVHYAENWSLLFDLRILAATALLVLFQRSAY